MIKIYNKESVENGVAVKYKTYYLFGLKIIELISTTTNSNIIYKLLTKTNSKIKGFNNKENENKN